MNQRALSIAVVCITSVGFAGFAHADLSFEPIDLTGLSDLFGSPNVDAFSAPASAMDSDNKDNLMNFKYVDDSDTEGPGPTVVPTPLSGALGAVGLGALAIRRRRRISQVAQ